MFIFNPNQVEELSPVELCNHLQRDFYTEIKGLLKAVQSCMDDSEDGKFENRQVLSLLFSKLEAETGQMMRYDEQLIFPLIRNGFGEKKYMEGQLPANLMQQMTIRILNLMEKTRKLLNNYLPRPEWQNCLHDTCSNLFRLEQLLQQAIYFKENYLVPKVKERFSTRTINN